MGRQHLAKIIALGCLSAVLLSQLGRALPIIGLPNYSSFVHIPLILGLWLAATALGLANNKLNIGIFGLLVTTLISTLLSDIYVSVVRGLSYWLLLAQPFMLFALLSETGSKFVTLRRIVILSLFIVLFLATVSQWDEYGIGDQVKGLYIDSMAGAHIAAGVALIVAVWSLGSLGPLLRICVFIAALFVAIVAEGKLILLTVLSSMVVVGLLHRKINLIQIFLGLLAFIVVLSIFQSIFSQWPKWVETFVNTRTASIQLIMENMSLADLIFGRGPGTTVSRFAFLAEGLNLKVSSGLRDLGLVHDPSPLAEQIAAEVEWVKQIYNVRSSIVAGRSSLTGIFGDLGLMGLVVFFWCFVITWSRIRCVDDDRRRWSYHSLCISWAFLGFIYEWFEQPEFSLVIVLLLADLSSPLSITPLSAMGADENEMPWGHGRPGDVAVRRNLANDGVNFSARA